MSYDFYKYHEFIPTHERVRDGAFWLDFQYPGWAEKINGPSIESKTECILCQVTGIPDWKIAKQHLGLEQDDSVMYGFEKMQCYESGGELITDSYEDLDVSWLKEINRRTQAPK